MKGIAGGRWLLTAVLGLAGLGCGSQVPQLITPEEAQDRVYHHLSQAEAFKVKQNPRAASIERTKARAYKDLIRSGRTTTRDEALAAAAAHQSRAASLRALGYTRFVGRELAAARRYEAFAARAPVKPAAASP